jgi:MFS family permease
VQRGAVKSSRHALPRTVILLGITSLATDVGTEMIFPLLPVFLVGTLGASPQFLGLVEGLADTVSSLLKLVAGSISDRLGRRKPLVVFGYGLASIVRPFVAIATAPWHVLAVRVVDRVGKGVRSAPRDALIADAAEKGGAGRAFGFHQAMDHTGAVLGPLLATALLALGVSIRNVFWLAVIPGVIATLTVTLVKEQRPASTSPSPSTSPSTSPSISPSIPPRLKSYLAIVLLFSIGNSSDAFLLLRARELGVSTTLIPVLWMVFNLVKVVSAWLAGDISDRMPRARLILLGWVLYAVTYLVLGIAAEPWQAWAIFLVYAVYYGMTEPAEKALVRDIAPAELRGRAFGWYNLVVGVTALPAGLLTGYLWKTYGHQVALGAGAAIAAVSGLLLLAWTASAHPDAKKL